MDLWHQDQFVVSKKQSNVCGEKELSKNAMGHKGNICQRENWRSDDNKTCVPNSASKGKSQM